MGSAVAAPLFSGEGRFASSGAWLRALRTHLAVIAAGNLAWEVLHMPLYTVWTSGTWKEIAFAALHCTGGDVLISLASLTAALLLVGDAEWPRSASWPVLMITVALGLAYTVFSEWLNIVIRAAWDYSDAMPVIPFAGLRVGVSPLLQWIVVPFIAFAWVRRIRPEPGAP